MTARTPGRLRPEAELLGTLDEALRSSPGDEAELAVHATVKNTTRFASSAIHQNSSEEISGATARVILGGRAGAASGNDLSAGGLADLLREAARFAASSPPLAGFRGLPGPTPLPPPQNPDEETLLLSPLDKGSRLKRIFDLAAARGAEMHGSFTTLASASAVANTRGIRVSQSSTDAETVLIGMTGQPNPSSGYASQCARALSLLPLEALAGEAVDKAIAARYPPKEIPPGRYDVVLEPAAISEILEWLSLIGFAARAFEDGSSFLCGREGERVTGESFTLYDDGSDPEGLPCRFDGEGVGKKKFVLIENGIGQSAVFDKATADRLGREPTGHALGARSEEGALPTNLFVAPGTTSREKLIGTMERGLWITRFHYLNGFLDPKQALMTGMTRDGAFWIEDGRVVAPIVNMRWTESILEAFSRIDGLTPDRRSISAWWGGGAANTVPAMRIRGFQFTGVSKR